MTCLNQRVNGHRSKCYEILESSKKNSGFSLDKPGDIEDENDLGLGVHLFTVHQKKERTDFNDCFMYNFVLRNQILCITCNPCQAVNFNLSQILLSLIFCDVNFFIILIKATYHIVLSVFQN